MGFYEHTAAISGNHLLSALQVQELAILKPLLQPMRLEPGTALFERGEAVREVYFPCGPTLISYVVYVDEAHAVETAMVGREGVIGGIVSHGRAPAYCRAVVQFPGPALRMLSTDLERVQQQSPQLRSLLSRYADCLLAQVFQSVACNAVHSIEQRTAKWLLSALDRTGDHMVPLTQEQIAGMLGVGRSYVGRVMVAFKSRGILETMRGKLRIHRLEELKHISCGCDKLVQAHFNEVLAGIYPDHVSSA